MEELAPDDPGPIRTYRPRIPWPRLPRRRSESSILAENINLKRDLKAARKDAEGLRVQLAESYDLLDALKDAAYDVIQGADQDHQGFMKTVGRVNQVLNDKRNRFIYDGRPPRWNV